MHISSFLDVSHTFIFNHLQTDLHQPPISHLFLACMLGAGYGSGSYAGDPYKLKNGREVIVSTKKWVCIHFTPIFELSSTYYCSFFFCSLHMHLTSTTSLNIWALLLEEAACQWRFENFASVYVMGSSKSSTCFCLIQPQRLL